MTGTGRSPLPHGDPPAEGYAVPRHVQTRQDLIAADRIDTLCSSTEGARSYGQGVGGICDDRAEEPRPSRRYWRRRQLLDNSDTGQIELGTPVCTNTHSADIFAGEECAGQHKCSARFMVLRPRGGANSEDEGHGEDPLGQCAGSVQRGLDGLRSTGAPFLTNSEQGQYDRPQEPSSEVQVVPIVIVEESDASAICLSDSDDLGDSQPLDINLDDQDFQLQGAPQSSVSLDKRPRDFDGCEPRHSRPFSLSG